MKSIPKPIIDSVGRIIPNGAVAYWNRKREIQMLLEAIKLAVEQISSGHESKDLMFSEIPESAVADLKSAYASIQCGIPYAVCPQCQGHPEVQPKGECRLCKGRGLVSKFRWNTVPAETRAMIENSSK